MGVDGCGLLGVNGCGCDWVGISVVVDVRVSGCVCEDGVRVIARVGVVGMGMDMRVSALVGHCGVWWCG